MQKMISFFELDKDGTWFAVLCFITIAILIGLILNLIRNSIYYINKKRTDRAESYKQKLLLKLIQNDEFELEKTSTTFDAFSKNIDEVVHNIQKFSKEINGETKNVNSKRSKLQKE